MFGFLKFRRTRKNAKAAAGSLLMVKASSSLFGLTKKSLTSILSPQKERGDEGRTPEKVFADDTAVKDALHYYNVEFRVFLAGIFLSALFCFYMMVFTEQWMTGITLSFSAALIFGVRAFGASFRLWQLENKHDGSVGEWLSGWFK